MRMKIHGPSLKFFGESNLECSSIFEGQVIQLYATNKTIFGGNGTSLSLTDMTDISLIQIPMMILMIQQLLMMLMVTEGHVYLEFETKNATTAGIGTNNHTANQITRKGYLVYQTMMIKLSNC